MKKRLLVLLVLLPFLGGCLSSLAHLTGLESLLLGSMIGMAGQGYLKPALDKYASVGNAPLTKDDVQKIVEEALRKQSGPPAPTTATPVPAAAPTPKP